MGEAPAQPENPAQAEEVRVHTRRVIRKQPDEGIDTNE